MLPDQRKDRPKRILRRPWRLGILLVSSAMGLAVLVGCRGSGGSEDTSETAKRLQTLHGLLSEYLMENQAALSKRPDSPSRPNAERFKEWVTPLPPHRIGDVDIQKLLVSPRDGEPFVINNDMPRSGPIPAIWEQTGVNGKRYVIYADGNVEEVDEETFTKIKPKK